jgi:hypothetical protein
MKTVWPELLISTVRILVLIAVSFALGRLYEREHTEPQPQSITYEIAGGWIFRDGESVAQIICKDKGKVSHD